MNKSCKFDEFILVCQTERTLTTRRTIVVQVYRVCATNASERHDND